MDDSRSAHLGRVEVSRALEVPLHLWGEILLLARRERRLTQAQLAEMVRLTQQSISKMEHGEVCPPDRHKLALAVALHVEARVLFPLPDLEGRLLFPADWRLRKEVPSHE